MIRLVFISLIVPVCFTSYSQDTISLKQVEGIIRFLASDSMKGRANGSAQLYKAARFIEHEFQKDSLLYFPGYHSFLQPFVLQVDTEGNSSDSVTLFNIVGVLEGKTKPAEVILFSAHYDHIGMDPSQNDSVFNGANDNASGTTALLALAHYFAKRKDNSRTLVFCAFAGEEWGMKGSSAFAENIRAESIVAMVNIEMIGSRKMAGKKAFFMTGERHSNLSGILKKNLKDSPYKLVSEPYSQKKLFERSDNFPFALKGVPAHTVMCSDDSDRCYHQACDELKHLDLENMTSVIKAIALSVRSIVDGNDTPSRIRY